MTHAGVACCWIERALLCGALLAATAAGCGRNSQPTFERPPAPVAVAAAVARDVPFYIDGVGKIAAREVVSIQPQVSGRILKLHFTDGADIKAGDLLFTIDPRPYRAQLSRAEANLAQSLAALELARVNFERVEKLTDPRAVARQDYDAKKSAVALAQAAVEQNRAAVESARLDLEYCTIRSPLSGRAGQRGVDAGNVVTANEGSLLVIQRLNPIYADFTIPENDLSVVQRQLARGPVRVEVRLPDEQTEPRDGKLTFLDNAVQDSAGTIKLRATLANGDRHFWPGRFVKVRLILRTERQAVLIPASAPQLSAKGSFVYVITPEMTAEQRSVKVGQQHDDWVVIDDSLRAGERVVVDGQMGVTPGGKVNVVEPESPGARSPTQTPPAKS